MTLYELLNKVSFILAKNNAEKLFEYTIHSMDHNGFICVRGIVTGRKPYLILNVAIKD